VAPADLAQVRNVYPEQGCKGNVETVASLVRRGRDTESPLESTRCLTFSVLISDGGCHLKNWSLICRDGRIPALISRPGHQHARQDDHEGRHILT